MRGSSSALGAFCFSRQIPSAGIASYLRISSCRWIGTIWGPVLGVIARTAVGKAGDLVAGFDGLGPIGDFFSLLDESAFVFGVGLIVLTFFFPRGLAGIGRKRQPSG